MTVPKHDHDHDHPAGVQGWIRSLLRPHSHDAADSVDAALESSAEGGIRAVKISLVALLVTAPLQAVVVFFTGSVALLIGAPSHFAIILLSLVLVTSVLGSSKLRGFISLLIGLTIGLVGLDLSTGQARLILGQLQLADGIDIVVVAVGIFALGEAPLVAAPQAPVDRRRPGRPAVHGPGGLVAFVAAVAARDRARVPVRRGARRWSGDADVPVLSGGAAPGEELRRVRQGGDRGRGRSEAANNASAAGTFVPLLALGLPVTATASIILAAMQSYGIQPGPDLLGRQADLVWTLLASLLIGNTLLLVINLPLAPVWARLLQIPRPQLYAGILFFAALGAYAVSQQALDLLLLLLLLFGLVGFAIRRFGLPVLPLILGVILGPLMETKMRPEPVRRGGDRCRRPRGPAAWCPAGRGQHEPR